MEGGWPWTPDRYHCLAFWRCDRPYSTKHWWSKVPAWKAQWNAHKGSFGVVPAAQVLWLGSHDVGQVRQSVFRSCGLDSACCAVKEGLYGTQLQHALCVLLLSQDSCALLLNQPTVTVLHRIYGWAVVILVRLGCWVWILARDSKRTFHCGKSPTNHFTSFPVYN